MKFLSITTGPIIQILKQINQPDSSIIKGYGIL